MVRSRSHYAATANERRRYAKEATKSNKRFLRKYLTWRERIADYFGKMERAADHEIIPFSKEKNIIWLLNLIDKNIKTIEDRIKEGIDYSDPLENVRRWMKEVEERLEEHREKAKAELREDRILKRLTHKFEKTVAKAKKKGLE